VTGEHRFEAILWLHDGEAPWAFVTLPRDLSDDIEGEAVTSSAFGSVRVEARIGETRWVTSLFPDSGEGAYVLPVKKQVRRQANIEIGDRVEVWVTLPGSSAP